MVKDLNDPTNVDTIPAMLTDGEFVLNKEATQMYGPIIEQMNNHGLQQRQAENQQYMVAANDGGWLNKLWFGSDEKYHRPKGGFKSKEHKKNWKNKRDEFYSNANRPAQEGYDQPGQAPIGVDWEGMRRTAAIAQKKIQNGERPNAMERIAHKTYFDHIKNGTFGQNNYNTGGLVSFLKEKEGYRDKAYQDQAGVWTIGYGRTTNPDGSPIKPGQTTSKEKEDGWLNKRAASERAAVNEYAKKHGYDWSEGQKDALASFRYNVGNIDQLTGGGKRTNEEIQQALPQYNKAGGQVSEGLVNRRNAELEMWGAKPKEQAAPPPAEAPPQVGFDPVQIAQQLAMPKQMMPMQAVGLRGKDPEYIESLAAGGVSTYNGGGPVQYLRNGGRANITEEERERRRLARLAGANNVSRGRNEARQAPMIAPTAPPQPMPGPSGRNVGRAGVSAADPFVQQYPDMLGVFGRLGGLINRRNAELAMWGAEGRELPAPPPAEAPPQVGFDPIQLAQLAMPQQAPIVAPQLMQRGRDPEYIQSVAAGGVSTFNGGGPVQYLRNGGRANITEEERERRRLARLAGANNVSRGRNEARQAPLITPTAPQQPAPGPSGRNVGRAGVSRSDPFVQQYPNMPDVGQAPSPGNVPQLQDEPPVPGSDEAILQGSSQAVEQQEQYSQGGAGRGGAPVELMGEEKNKIASTLKETFGDLFDRKELARMGVLMLGGMVTGMSPGQALAFAGTQYLNRLDAKQANYDQIAASGKYTKQSVAEYKKTGDPNVLTAVGTPPERTGNFVTKWTKDGKQVQLEEVKVGDSTYLADKDGNIKSGFDYVTDPPEVRGSKEYRTRVKTATGNIEGQLKEMRETFDVFDKEKGSAKTDILPSTNANKIAQWAVDMERDPEHGYHPVSCH